MQDFFAEFSTKIANITIERDRANQELFHLRTESEKEIARLKEDLAKENQDLKLKLEKTAEKRVGLDDYITENQSLRQKLLKLNGQFNGKSRETELLKLQLSAASDPKTIADLRSELDLLREELGKKDSENRILTATKDSNPSLAKVFVLEAENRTQKAQINRFEETTKQSEIASKNTASIIRDLETQIAGGPEKLANLQKQLESVTSALESQTLRVNEESSLRQRAEGEVAKLQNVKKINEDLKGTLKQVSIAKNNVERISSEIQRKNSALIKEVEDQKQSFLAEMLIKGDELIQQQNRSREEINDLKREHDLRIQKLQSEVDAANAESRHRQDLLDARALDEAIIKLEINDANLARRQAEGREAEALKAQRDAEEDTALIAKQLFDETAAKNIALATVVAKDDERKEAVRGRLANFMEKEAAIKAKRDAEATTIIVENRRAAEEALRIAAERREAAEIALKNAAILNHGNMTLDRNARILERDNALNDVIARTAERDAARIEAANKERLKLDAERLKTTEENAKINALARLTASERNLSDLQKSSSYEVSVAKSQRDKALEDIERLQRRLEKQSSAPEHKIIREFEKTFKPNYKKASDLLFGDKTEKEKNIEIDYYRNHRHKIYQDDDTKLAHTKIDLSEASDEEVIREIAKDRERAVRNSLPKLVAKLIGQKNKESVIENLSRTDIVIALSVGNSEEFDQWKKDNSDANIGATFFGKLEKGSKAQEIRSKAIENLLEGIKGYAAFFGVDDSKVLKPDIKPNTSPQFATIDALSEKFKSRS